MGQRKRNISSYTRFLAAPPVKVFPQLCPTREYDWIEVWRCNLVHSDSGIAEGDCVFMTEGDGTSGPETWTCSRYEPPSRIDYVRMSAHRVVRLELRLEPAGAGTRLTVTHVMSALDDAGDAMVGACHAGTSEEHFKPLLIMLEHYLKTGKMLPRDKAMAAAAA
ncbi:MAG TPA: SRPBCC domain-containing protein [Rhizomicrobium sp.]|nr:SRPBCC domain-containing protein [Rhizomicrobium sp.]